MTKPHADKWSHILTLMTAIIVVDKNVHKAEIETFLKGASLLADRLGIETSLTRGALGHWFELKRDEIEGFLNDSFMDSYIVSHILALEDFPLKKELLECFQMIAEADHEVHTDEKSIIHLAAAYWGLPLSQLSTELSETLT